MKICKKGHEYNESRKYCSVCQKIYDAERYASDPEKYRKKSQQWRNENPEYSKQYSIDNHEKCSERSRRWYFENSERARENNKRWRGENKNRKKETNKQWYRLNKDRKKETNKAWRALNPEKVKNKNKQWYIDNIEYVSDYNKKRRSDNPNYQKEYEKKRSECDPLFKLIKSLRSAIGKSIKRGGYSKKSKTHQMLGAGFETVYNHLVLSAMNNYGEFYSPLEKYEIDHITPCSNANSEEELIKLQHYTNLQWLTKEDNLSKADKLDWNISKDSVTLKRLGAVC